MHLFLRVVAVGAAPPRRRRDEADPLIVPDHFRGDTRGFCRFADLHGKHLPKISLDLTIMGRCKATSNNEGARMNAQNMQSFAVKGMHCGSCASVIERAL